MTNPFQTGLCGCMEDKASCIDTFCCYCCQVGRQFKAAEGEVNQLSVLYCCLSLCFPYCCSALLRCKVVDTLSIDENKIVSCCLGIICMECSICQTHRQLTLAQRFPGGLCVSKPYTDGMV
jgi:Cys-rich protein (TIGR01571 family)